MKRPSAPIMLSSVLAVLIGRIVLTWSSFERQFDDLLAAILRANGTDEPNWNTRSFRRRRQLMRAEAAKFFSAHPEINGYIRNIFHDTVELQESRNFIAHGKIWIKVETGEYTPAGDLPGRITLIFIRESRGGPHKQEFTSEQLETLFYDLAHLTGRLGAIILNAESLSFSLPDRSFLQEFLNRDYRSPPTPPI
jgi:hypothetical protein